MKYRILEARGSLEKLVADVNNLIEQGWKPLGGVCRSDDKQDYANYVQAMTKE